MSTRITAGISDSLWATRFVRMLWQEIGYAYDGRNRMTEISYPSALGGYTEKLGYDAAGNRIRRKTAGNHNIPLR